MTENGLQHDVGVIVAAAGRGERFQPERCKLLQDLHGIPVVCHCLRNFAPVVSPERMILVIPSQREGDFRKALEAGEVHADVQVVPGGATRSESVMNGLHCLPAGTRLVAVQDAARPCSTARLLLACIASARERGSGVPAREVTDTIKLVGADGDIIETLDRSRLWAAETPQVFPRHLLESAYRNVLQRQLRVTDDAQAVEMLGERVFLVRHREPNPKITFTADLQALRTRQLPHLEQDELPHAAGSR